MATWKKLDIFWKRTNCPAKFKLIVYDAVIRSKLVYGLNCVHIPEAVITQLNAFQLKGLRKILKITTTFVDRTHTNKMVFEQANRVRFAPNTRTSDDGDNTRNANNATQQIMPVIPPPAPPTNKKIKQFSEYIHEQQNELLAHIIRADNNDPMRMSALDTASDRPRTHNNRRAGRPRQHLIHESYKRVWNLIPGNEHSEFDIPLQTVRELNTKYAQVAAKARGRLPPFRTSNI